MRITLSMWPPRRPNRTGSRTAPSPYLNDEQWDLISELFAEPPMSSLGGRPRVPPRECLEGVLWILVSGARWQDLPERYPSPATCWRRLKLWSENGTFLAAWQLLLGRLEKFRGINWAEAIADGTFSPAKKGAPTSATRKRGKGPRSC